MTAYILSHDYQTGDFLYDQISDRQILVRQDNSESDQNKNGLKRHKSNKAFFENCSTCRLTHLAIYR